MIITNNEELLRVSCSLVVPEELGNIIESLENELKYANRLGKNGIGLAAPQIGIAKQAAIIRMPNFNFNLINAKIIHSYDPSVFHDEGCLSFPGRVENTTRFQEVHIVDNMEYPESFIATGIIAIVCQHELDHLNQTLFMDHMLPKAPTFNKTKVGPNDKCACGSLLKYKKCCRRKL